MKSHSRPPARFTARTTSLLVASALLPACARPPAGPAPAVPDAPTTDPEKYRVMFENERVRVLEYRDHPGDRTRMHRHPEFVMIALTPFRRKLTFPDGTSRERAFEAGEALWMPAQAHVGENVGADDTHVILVELKPPGGVTLAP